ncbi:glycosyltransferase family 2 protein [Flavobacterium sp. TSSA_36]|uniref:glycosyltransferase family 2 protein n=1 Tax=Flavobacterium sp. TSSA_36 TaxID=3447669 RepID=UPI003F36549C
MITILYPYRNREVERIKRSLDSLALQTDQCFKVLFVDYGSKQEMANDVECLLQSYSFVNYFYLYTRFQPWNKSKALNFAIKKCDTDYCFVADVDMIFHPELVSLLISKCEETTITYFKVGFLSKLESSKSLAFNKYQIKFYTNHEATGISLLPVKKLKEVQGYDEFFHFWGAEDTDLHNRLRSLGCTIAYFDTAIMMLHQWHPNYRKRETKRLNLELQLSGIVEHNHLHLVNNLDKRVTKVNHCDWGNCISLEDFDNLNKVAVMKMDNNKTKIDYFLFHQLPKSKNEILAIEIKENQEVNSLKHNIKQLMRKKTNRFYDLKTINDMILQHVVSFYHAQPYSYQVGSDLKTLVFKIKT